MQSEEASAELATLFEHGRVDDEFMQVIALAEGRRELAQVCYLLPPVFLAL